VENRHVETLLLHAVVLAVIGFHAVRRRVDVFPLAMIAASLIVLGTLGTVLCDRYHSGSAPWRA
jgi:hypothetical protein